MSKHGIRRLVTISAAGVGDSFQKVSPLMRLLIRNSNIERANRDFENMEEVYEKSNIDSLAVRPVGLVNGQTNNRAKLVDRFNFSSQIAKRDVAEWMLDAVERSGTFNTPTEMIGWG
ncbi:NAD(P)H-binding protein [Photobacterium sp. SDRW27]|nr:NAD(P)H-binding protein [Photobacterium obscurum]